MRVLEIDIARKRISMSMKKDQTESKKTARNEKKGPTGDEHLKESQLSIEF